MNQNQKIVWGVVVILLLIVVGWAVWRYANKLERSPTANGVADNVPYSYTDIGRKLHILLDVPKEMPNIRIENNLSVRNVYFCGGTYKAQRILINNIDVVERISIILKEDPQKSDWFCNMMRGRALNEGGMLGNGDELDITIAGSRPYDISLSFSQKPSSSFPFLVDSEKNTITTIDGGILGALK